jgi:ferredoxin
MIFNEQYTKEQYKDELEKINTGSYLSRNQSFKKFAELKRIIPRKYASILNSPNSIGDDILDSRNCFWCFNAKDNVENCKYSFRLDRNIKDGYDGYIVWNGAELFYDTLSSTGRNFKFSGMIWGGYDVEYSFSCFDCNNIFGCTGLRNKSYCILNRQYSKDEYEKLIVKIRELMLTKGEYGEFFPVEISPFAYNETPAQEYFPKSKETALAMGYKWKDSEEKSYPITIRTEDIIDDIRDVPDSITKEVLECAHKGKCEDQCSTAFRIIPIELSFLRRFNIPLPRLCFGCRHMERIRQKPPLNLWHRSCTCEQVEHGHNGKCPSEFETSYVPGRPEIVYCESCYQKEVL